ncbi:MAG TPA: phosphoribosyl-ATP diphosphatase [Methylomirabilota bacterium]|nr:phosphoribosyl-ATP diphosphatase [Methylomirabilota bacterium]
MVAFSLHDLESTVDLRISNGDQSSYTRKLVGRGMETCAQKLGEEAIEAVIAAVSGDRKGLVSETADLLYHLLVVLRVAGVSLDEVMAELHGRRGHSGLDEKASRPKD